MEYPEPEVLVPAKQSMLAWILFALTLVGAIGIGLAEEQKLGAANGRLATAAQAEQKARADLADAQNAKRTLETRVQELQAENGRLTVKVAAAAKIDPPKKTHARASKKTRRKHHKRG